MRREMTAEHDRDLALAAALQSALLPVSCPNDCSHQRAAARNRMCKSIGGDFYDFLRLNEDQIAIVIGDVVGHGVRSSLMMAKLMGWLRSRPENMPRPAKLVADLNRMLIELGEKVDAITSCSLFYGIIDAPTGVGLFVNAGHPRPFLCDRNSCQTLPMLGRNMVLGVEEFEPEEACHTFTPGQRFVLYTDGVVDAQNAEGEHFGEQRLHEVIDQHAGDDVDICADAVFAATEAFRGDVPAIDDETIVVIDRV